VKKRADVAILVQRLSVQMARQRQPLLIIEVLSSIILIATKKYVFFIKTIIMTFMQKLIPSPLAITVDI
jgi:hypothetical protein